MWCLTLQDKCSLEPHKDFGVLLSCTSQPGETRAKQLPGLHPRWTQTCHQEPQVGSEMRLAGEGRPGWLCALLSLILSVQVVMEDAGV